MRISTIQASIIVKEFPTDGHSPLLIIGNDVKRYVAKNSKGHKPPIAVINECIANNLLNSWGISVPGFVLVSFDKLLIQSCNLSANHKVHFYNDLSFGSELIENPIDVNDFTYSVKKSFYNRIINPIDFFHIALFDLWVENDDRKPTNYNLLFQPLDSQLKIIPIDHAFIFSTLKHSDLNAEMFSPIDNEHLLVSDFGRLMKHYTAIDKDFIEKEKQYFYLCVDNCTNTFKEFFSELSGFFSMPDGTLEKIEKFLFNAERNKKVFEEYIYRLEQ